MAQTITRSISIDVAQENRLQPIVAKQYDRASRFLNVQFLDMGTEMTIEAGATIVINAKRSDGQGLSFSGSVNSDGTVRVPITYWMLELDGPVVCDISIITGSSADTMLTSTSFTLEVQAAAVTNADVEENEDYPVLLELIHEVSEFEPELLDIRNGVHGQTFNSAGDAVRANANQLYNMKTGFDGVTYASPAAMVQGCDTKLQNEIDYKMDIPWSKVAELGTREKGLFNHVSGEIDFSTYGNYRYVKISVEAGDHYCVSGNTFNNNANYSAVTFVKSDDSVLSYIPSERIEGAFPETLIQVPNNAAYMYVNGFTSSKTGESHVYSVAFKTLDETVEKAVNDNFAPLCAELVPFTKENGLYDPSDLDNPVTWGNYSRIKIAATAGKQYIVSCQTINQYRAWIFADSSSNVLSMAQSGNAVYNNIVITAPDDTAYLYLNSAKADVSVRVFEYSVEAVINLNETVKTIQDSFNPNYVSYITEFINCADMIKRTRIGCKSFSYSGFDTGYMTLIFDDGRHDLSTVKSICDEYEIPLCAAIPTNTLSNLCDNNQTVKQVCQGIVTSGGEILSHSVNGYVLESKTDYSWLKAGLMKSKEILVGEGFDIRGFIRPGGPGAIDWDGNNLQRFTQMFYDYSDRCGDVGSPYYNPRTGLGYTDLATAKGYVDDAMTNHKWYTFMSHTLDGSEYYLTEEYFRAFVEYAVAQGIQFKTYAYMYDHFATWS